MCQNLENILIPWENFEWEYKKKVKNYTSFMKAIEEKILEIATKKANPESEYYSITFTADSNGKVVTSCYSHFVERWKSNNSLSHLS